MFDKLNAYYEFYIEGEQVSPTEFFTSLNKDVLENCIDPAELKACMDQLSNFDTINDYVLEETIETIELMSLDGWHEIVVRC